MVVTFWLLLFLLVYAYFGYPLLVIMAAQLLRRTWHRASIEPQVTVIIAAYNEEADIGARLDDVLASNYPAQRLQVIVASDGSDDATERIVTNYPDQRVLLLPCARRGKLFALDDAIRKADTEILCFTDANTRFDKEALRRLVRNFADPSVGGVSGRVVYTSNTGADTVGRGEGLYWSYESHLKNWESLTGNVISGTGKIYAIRRDLYRTPPTFSGTDDFLISTSVIEEGYRLVYDDDARAYQTAASSGRDEFGRKVRMVTRGLNSVFARRRLLNIRHFGFYAVSLFSHKILRRLVPLILLSLLACSLALAPSHPFYFASFLLQLTFLGLAAAGWLVRHHAAGAFRVLYIPYFFCLSNAALLAALFTFLAGKPIAAWETKR